MSQAIQELTTLWLEAKELEKIANARRLEIELELLELVGSKEEGSQTTEDGAFVIKTTGRLSYKANPEEIMLRCCTWPAEEQPAYLAPKLDELRLKKIRANDPEKWRAIADLIEVKPMKVGVAITVKDES